MFRLNRVLLRSTNSVGFLHVKPREIKAMKFKQLSITALLLACSPLVIAKPVALCQDLSGIWQAPDQSHSYVMNISPTGEVCGENCVVFNVSYTLDKQQTNQLICHEGQAGESGKVPMVLSFEGKYGGHSIGTYNRELNLLWTGVLAKDAQKNWQPNMKSYWFKKVK